MRLIVEIEQRLNLYRDFLGKPPSEHGNFSENSYERKAYNVALRRTLRDAFRLLRIVKMMDEEKPIPLTRIKRR